MFNKKLEDKVKDLEQKLAKANQELRLLNSDIQSMQPEDCKKGNWCKSCKFGKESRTYFGPEYICMKGACKSYEEK